MRLKSGMQLETGISRSWKMGEQLPARFEGSLCSQKKRVHRARCTCRACQDSHFPGNVPEGHITLNLERSEQDSAFVAMVAISR